MVSSFIQLIEKVDGGIVILSSCKYHFIKVNENLMQHPSNHTSISMLQAKNNLFYSSSSKIIYSLNTIQNNINNKQKKKKHIHLMVSTEFKKKVLATT